jgi:hypothetical protein
MGMTESMLRRAATLEASAHARIRTGCGHALVPATPAARGYRYYDLGGSSEPFYLRRVAAGPIVGAVTLTAPIELSSGDAAEPGAPGLVRVGVSIGVTSLAWPRLLDQDGRGGVWSDLVGQALAEVARLDLLTPAQCPVCGAG